MSYPSFEDSVSACLRDIMLDDVADVADVDVVAVVLVFKSPTGSTSLSLLSSESSTILLLLL